MSLSSETLPRPFPERVVHRLRIPVLTEITQQLLDEVAAIIVEPKAAVQNNFAHLQTKEHSLSYLTTKSLANGVHRVVELRFVQSEHYFDGSSNTFEYLEGATHLTYFADSDSLKFAFRGIDNTDKTIEVQVLNVSATTAENSGKYVILVNFYPTSSLGHELEDHTHLKIAVTELPIGVKAHTIENSMPDNTDPLITMLRLFTEYKKNMPNYQQMMQTLSTLHTQRRAFQENLSTDSSDFDI